MSNSTKNKGIVHSRLAASAFLAIVTLFLPACVTTEVPQSPIADLRPTVQFRGAEHPPAEIVVYVNGLKFGTVSDYDDPEEMLRLLAGEQKVELKFENEVIFSEVLQLANGGHEVLYLSLPSAPIAAQSAPESVTEPNAILNPDNQ